MIGPNFEATAASNVEVWEYLVVKGASGQVVAIDFLSHPQLPVHVVVWVGDRRTEGRWYPALGLTLDEVPSLPSRFPRLTDLLTIQRAMDGAGLWPGSRYKRYGP